MALSDEVTQELVRVRDKLLETRSWPANLKLRPEIANSWRRCLLNGVSPDGHTPKYDPNGNRDGQLRRAAHAVLQKRLEQLENTPTSLILADRDGWVLERATTDSELKSLFESANVQPGVLLDESSIGTNATGTVVEDRRPIQIRGGEHFVTGLQGLACAGAPILHPITRRLRGVLSIACPIEHANGLLLPFTMDVAHEIEQRLYVASSRDERLLLEQFLLAQKRTSRPIIALNEKIIISSPAAARTVDELGQSLLWESAAQVIESKDGRTLELPLATGEVVSVRCRPIEDGPAIVGALVEIETHRPVSRTPRPSAHPAEAAARPVDGLAGASSVWCDAHTQAVACRDHGVPIVLVGEPGVGKFALARSLFAEQLRTDRFSVFDAALQPIDGAAAWVTAVHHALADLDRVVVIRHLDLLEASAAHALCGLLDAGVARAQMVATSTEGLDAEPAHRPLMNRLAIAPIWVPPLRDHLGDLPDLLAALTRKHADGQRELRWLPDAVQTLTRLDWPTNIGQLENLVRRVLITCRNAYVSGNELPEDVRSRAPRRRLSHMERLELDAIMASLRQTSGNKSAAADLLGISRATLYRKVRRFGVDLEKSAF